MDAITMPVFLVLLFLIGLVAWLLSATSDAGLEKPKKIASGVKG